MWYCYWSLKYSDCNFRGLARAKQAFKSQNYEDIIPACSEEIETGDENHKMEALVLRATFHLLLGEHNKALSDLEAVIENEDANVKVMRVAHTESSKSA
jgi:import receptor subunit TOM70